MMSSVDHKQYLKSDKTFAMFSQAEGLNRLKAAPRTAMQK
jgi:hypothetical protein